MGSKGYSDEVSVQNEEQFMGQWRKGNPCYEVVKSRLVFVM